MLIQVILKNIYNFNDEVIIDFTTKGNNDDFPYFNIDGKKKINISNIALIYGKNNVGKSNFFKSLHQAILFIKTGKFLLQQNRTTKDKRSHIELTLATDIGIIRYGFEFTLDLSRHEQEKHVIHDEWMFFKKLGKSRESLVYDRIENKFNRKISSKDQNYMENVKQNELYISYLAKSNNEVVNEFYESITTKILFLSCFDSEINQLMNPKVLESIIDNEEYKEVIASLVRNMDTGIKNFSIKKIEPNFMALLKSFIEQNEELSKLDENSNEYLSKLESLQKNIGNVDFLTHLQTSGQILGFENKKSSRQMGFLLSFVDYHDNIYTFNELSSGTKQIFNLALYTQYAYQQNNCTMLFDEIDSGLHFDVVEAYLEFVNRAVKSSPKLQLVASSHQEKLLDLPFISTESVILFKENNRSVNVEYLSEYRIRKDQILSKRFLVDAFNVSPNIINSTLSFNNDNGVEQ